ncbi:hypothetical protein [Paenibacillus sp. BJ-4]|uniref:hypothetical protein n=1 Tax=Paenibacillus sp. BJ-4 TaxID=2878097 RepID=UPI001CF04023|nr:hypothetical protein [Paenibacillus sp. BJ-4]
MFEKDKTRLEQALYEALVRGQEQGEFSTSREMRALVRYLYHARYGMTQAAKLTDDPLVIEQITAVTLRRKVLHSFSPKLERLVKIKKMERRHFRLVCKGESIMNTTKYKGLALFILAISQLVMALDYTIIFVDMPSLGNERALQGLGGALLSPATLSLIMSNFNEGPERNRATGIWASMGGVGMSHCCLAGC